MKPIIHLLLLLSMGEITHAQTSGAKLPSQMLFDQIPSTEYDPAILYYSDQAVQGETPVEVLENTLAVRERELAAIPADKITYRYGFTKWSVGEVLQHVISYEHIMRERALITAGIITKDFKYQKYTRASTARGGNSKSKEELVGEFLEVRKATIAAFRAFDEAQLKKIGQVDGFEISVRMTSLCISGHQMHHFRILHERYGIL